MPFLFFIIMNQIEIVKRQGENMFANFSWKNNGKIKICIGLGTRPEIIRLAAVIRRYREYFDCCVIYCKSLLQ